MCVVIAIEDGNFPTKTTLEDAESLNSHGGSIAWLNHNGSKSYRKGIKAKKINKIIQRELKPKGITTAIIHFRIASVGAVNKQLCHPFEMTSSVELNLRRDNIKSDLLFHNGTWDEYAEEMLIYLSKLGKPTTVPQGDYSDSRVMAYLGHRLGHAKMAKLITGWNKLAILTDKGIVKYGTGWVKVDGVECSNDYFSSKYSYGAWEDSIWYKNGYTYGKSDEEESDDDYLPINYKEAMTPVQKEIIDTIKKEHDVSNEEIKAWLSQGYSPMDIEYLVTEGYEQQWKQLEYDPKD